MIEFTEKRLRHLDAVARFNDVYTQDPSARDAVSALAPRYPAVQSTEQVGRRLSSPIRLPAKGSLEYKAREKRVALYLQRMAERRRAALEGLLHAHLTPGQNVLVLLSRARRKLPIPTFVHCFGCQLPSSPSGRTLLDGPTKAPRGHADRVCARTISIRRRRGLQ